MRKASPELAIELRQQLGIAGKARGQCPRSRGGSLVRNGIDRRRRCERLGEACRDGLVATQDVIGMDAERAFRDLGGDVGIAVAVAADPRAPAQERRHQRRSRPGPSRVGRFAGGGGPRRAATPTTADLVEEASVARRTRGTALNSVSSKNASAVRTSSSGLGVTARRSAVRHSSVISSRRRRRASRSSAGGRSGSSRRASRRSTRRRASSSVRRRASVGWAVRTGVIRNPWTSWSASSSGAPRSDATVAAIGSSRVARSRRRADRT